VDAISVIFASTRQAEARGAAGLSTLPETDAERWGLEDATRATTEIEHVNARGGRTMGFQNKGIQVFWRLCCASLSNSKDVLISSFAVLESPVVALLMGGTRRLGRIR
jgi:hypothetical protein